MSPRGLLLLNYRNFCFLLEAEPTTSGNVYNPSNLSGRHHFSISIRILETKFHNKWKTLISKDQTKWIAWLSSLIFCGQCEILDFKKFFWWWHTRQDWEKGTRSRRKCKDSPKVSRTGNRKTTMEAGPVEGESGGYARHPSGLWLVDLGVREQEEQRGFGDMNLAAGAQSLQTHLWVA